MNYDYPDNWKEISEQVRARAGYKCQKCGRSFMNNKIALHAHHIIPLSKGGRNCLSNLMAVCEECHSKIHHKVINTSKFKKSFNKRKFVKTYD